MEPYVIHIRMEAGPLARLQDLTWATIPGFDVDHGIG